MSTEENKAIVRRWFSEVVSNGDMSCLDEICAVCHPQFAMVRGVVEPAPQGIPGLKDLIASFRTAFPDLTATVDEQVAEAEGAVQLLVVAVPGDVVGCGAFAHATMLLPMGAGCT